MPFEQKSVAETDILVLKFKADHQTLSAVFLDSLVVLECRLKILSDLCCILYKVLFLNDVKYCKRSCTSQVITSECCSEHAIYRFDLWADQHSADREAVCHTLGSRDDVCLHAMMLMCEELTCAAVT